MAKFILSLFGSISILIGMLILIFGLFDGRIFVEAATVYTGSAFLLTGAPLLGFGQVIDLLERIEKNTSPSTRTPNASNKNNVPQAVDLRGNSPGYEQPIKGNTSSAIVVERKFYEGREYSLHGDAIVTASVAGDTMSWINEAHFKEWAAGQSREVTLIEG